MSIAPSPAIAGSIWDTWEKVDYPFKAAVVEFSKNNVAANTDFHNVNSPAYVPRYNIITVEVNPELDGLIINVELPNYEIESLEVSCVGSVVSLVSSGHVEYVNNLQPGQTYKVKQFSEPRNFTLNFDIPFAVGYSVDSLTLDRGVLSIYVTPAATRKIVSILDARSSIKNKQILH